eukprot:CAMPEP_0202339396 /NCGR_PEP_ID=MMETSP1126-20121109/1278_1 /ASSEMBLY_ACC=CAM_ASM_000457 /TAXON_ID=3047 /ORGANISM="Dunaliella tertiolecta, Strain CCMP1320" /LENGTH=98 /DNA_ID=CAMNT_0048929945 /DNA_START=1663 /DNA_END=1959 /DNA_ORIENTATION=+
MGGKPMEGQGAQVQAVITWASIVQALIKGLHQRGHQPLRRIPPFCFCSILGWVASDRGHHQEEVKVLGFGAWVEHAGHGSSSQDDALLSDRVVPGNGL